MKIRTVFIGLLLIAGSGRGDVTQCACDPAKPETMRERPCSLCNEAEKQPADVEFFVLKDINPRKPGRWLVLPRKHGEAEHAFHKMPADERTRMWKFAIAAAREKFGVDWGLAYNGVKVRTQCHMHIHIGKFIPAAENSKFRIVKRVEDLPAPEFHGVFVHPVKSGFHVHEDEQIMETALVR